MVAASEEDAADLKRVICRAGLSQKLVLPPIGRLKFKINRSASDKLLVSTHNDVLITAECLNALIQFNDE
jgi:hypothetical protein